MLIISPLLLKNAVIQSIATKLTTFCITQNFNVSICEFCPVKIMFTNEQP